MLTIDDDEIQERYLEWGVQSPDGDVFESEDEQDARMQSELLYPGSIVVARKVYETGWSEIKS